MSPFPMQASRMEPGQNWVLDLTPTLGCHLGKSTELIGASGGSPLGLSDVQSSEPLPTTPMPEAAQSTILSACPSPGHAWGSSVHFAGQAQRTLASSISQMWSPPSKWLWPVLGVPSYGACHGRSIHFPPATEVSWISSGSVFR